MVDKDRFWAKVEKADGCWMWLASGSGGYGYFWIDGRKIPAHRFAYELLVGPIPEGLTLGHLCRNRACVNPAHLEPVTGRENTLRGEGLAAEEARRTHCPQGHAYDGLNTYHYRGRRYCRTCRRQRATARGIRFSVDTGRRKR